MRKIAFVVQQPRGISPGQRFRFEQWEPVLRGTNLRVKTFSFFDHETVAILYKKGHIYKKIFGVLKGYIRRCVHIFQLLNYDVIYLQREFAPLGPPVFEWIIAKLCRKKTIYDFDDAIWIPNTSTENRLASYLKGFWKVAKICKWSTIVTAGNDFLASFAKESGASKVVYLPTVVDTENRYIPAKPHNENQLPTIGWTGSHSTLKYLDALIPVLQELEKEIDFKFLVIANKNPELPLKNFEFLKWNEETEIKDLQKIHIGVMPLTADKWSEGKCGFKLIQYMALGIPAVASPVGVNKEIIDNGRNGFLCASGDEWKNKLKGLLTNEKMRLELGNRGIETINDRYSINSQKEKFLQLFR